MSIPELPPHFCSRMSALRKSKFNFGFVNNPDGPPGRARAAARCGSGSITRQNCVFEETESSCAPWKALGAMRR